jgi:hypothetical protein
MNYNILRKTALVPYRGEMQVKAGDVADPGDRLTEGPLDPQVSRLGPVAARELWCWS